MVTKKKDLIQETTSTNLISTYKLVSEEPVVFGSSVELRKYGSSRFFLDALRHLTKCAPQEDGLRLHHQDATAFFQNVAKFIPGYTASISRNQYYSKLPFKNLMIYIYIYIYIK